MNTNTIDTILIACGLAISLSDIQSTLSIIILIVQIVWIFAKAFSKIFTHIKNKEYGLIDDEVKDLKEDLEEVQENINIKDGDK